MQTLLIIGVVMLLIPLGLMAFGAEDMKQHEHEKGKPHPMCYVLCPIAIIGVILMAIGMFGIEVQRNFGQ